MSYSFQTNTTEYTITTPVIPADDTTPTVSEGVEIFSKNFTPSDASSIINFEFGFTASGVSSNCTMGVALFEGSTCIGAMPITRQTADEEFGVVRFRAAATDTSERTYSIRVAPEAQTLYLNRTNTAGVGHGGTELMWFEIDEGVVGGRQYHSEFDTVEQTIASLIALDDSTPLVSEGVEIFSQSFTPTEADSNIVVGAEIQFDAQSGTYGYTAAIFEDSTCIGSLLGYVQGGENKRLVVKAQVAASDTTARTYSVRMGSTNTSFGQIYLNDDVTASTGHNGNEGSLFEIKEHAP